MNRTKDLPRLNKSSCPGTCFIKLDDTVAVMPTSYEIFGEGGRGRNLDGASL
jgi:hypothetical protein